MPCFPIADSTLKPGAATRTLAFLTLVALLQACSVPPEAAPTVVDAPQVVAGPAEEEPVSAPVGVDVLPITPSEPPAPSDKLSIVFTASGLDVVQRGMSPAEVDALVGTDGVRIGGDGGEVALWRWRDEVGNRFTARFDEGKLRTRSRLRSADGGAMEESAAANSEEVGSATEDGAPLAQIAPGVFVPLERAIASANSQPMGVDEGGPRLSALSPPSVRRAPEVESPREGPTVVVAGAARREQDGGSNKTRSYNPHARLPAFTRSLAKGRYEIRLLNTTATEMMVGLRQEKLGEDFRLAPGGQASIFVDKGVYGLSFICDDEPDACYEAQALRIDGFRAADIEVHLSREDVDVRRIDYSLPEISASAP